MNTLLSAKGADVTTWRGAVEFTSLYRQALLDLAVSNEEHGVETVFSATSAAVDADIATHKKLLERLNGLIEAAAETATLIELKELAAPFYKDLYRHFDYFRSAPIFYQLSMDFLQQASRTIILEATSQLGLSAGQLPKLALIAVGPAGRREYSPFCPLQILLVHEETPPSQSQAIGQFCSAVHAAFETAGMVVDPLVTPRNARWRGTLAEWQQRCKESLYPKSDEELIDLCRLADQYPLYPVEGLAMEFGQLSRATLSGNRPALTNLVDRITSLSNGLGIMGRLKLERSGKGRGLFSLLDHGLLPFSAASSALALLRKSIVTSNPERIHDLLRRRNLSVELAERMLATWHKLHELQLQQEQSFRVDHPTKPSLFLNPDEMTVDQQQMLKQTLEAVATIQQHVAIAFSGMGE